jgi:methylenetetrahydrofolate reductase (NADPH)
VRRHRSFHPEAIFARESGAAGVKAVAARAFAGRQSREGRRMNSDLSHTATRAGALAELLANASIEIAPRERAQMAQIAEALPAESGIYVPAPKLRPLSETLDAIGAARRAGLDPVPHIAARRFASRAELQDFLRAAVEEHGVHRALVIAGDEAAPHGPYADAAALLRDGLLARAGIREIGISGYPEGHPRIDAAALDAAFDAKLALAREQGLGVYGVTQFSFAPTRILAWCARLARRAPEIALYIGMAGPTDPMALARYAAICGVSESLRALRNLGLDGIGDLAMHTDPEEQLHALAHWCDANPGSNVVGIHLYSFGGALRSARWLEARLHRR